MSHRIPHLTTIQNKARLNFIMKHKYAIVNILQFCHCCLDTDKHLLNPCENLAVHKCAATSALGVNHKPQACTMHCTTICTAKHLNLPLLGILQVYVEMCNSKLKSDCLVRLQFPINRTY